MIESVGTLILALLSTESWLLDREGTSSMLGTDPGRKVREDREGVVFSRMASGCDDRPPTLLMPQNGSNSRWPETDSGGCVPGMGIAVVFVADSLLSAQRLKAL